MQALLDLCYLYNHAESDIERFENKPPPSTHPALPSASTSSTLPYHPLSSSIPILSPHRDTQTINLLLMLLGTATTIAAQVLPIPSSITFAKNPIPGATNSTSTSSQKNVVTSGRCGIHVIQFKCAESFAGIYLRMVDWNGNIQYAGDCTGSVCVWPLFGMGDFLVSVQEGYTTTISFHRQGTVSQDSWLNTDPDPRCRLGPWGDCLRQFDCGFACEEYEMLA